MSDWKGWSPPPKNNDAMSISSKSGVVLPSKHCSTHLQSLCHLSKGSGGISVTACLKPTWSFTYCFPGALALNVLFIGNDFAPWLMTANTMIGCHLLWKHKFHFSPFSVFHYKSELPCTWKKAYDTRQRAEAANVTDWRVLSPEFGELINVSRCNQKDELVFLQRLFLLANYIFWFNQCSMLFFKPTLRILYFQLWTFWLQLHPK